LIRFKKPQDNRLALPVKKGACARITAVCASVYVSLLACEFAIPALKSPGVKANKTNEYQGLAGGTMYEELKRLAEAKKTAPMLDMGPYGTFPHRLGILRKAQFFPLSPPPHKLVVTCNEQGYWSSHTTDKNGYNNSKVPSSIDILLVGDSYAQGYCVRETETIQARLTMGGVNTYSLGRGGNGPLTSYAALTEFLKSYSGRVKKIIYLHYLNDNEGLGQQSLLMEFTNPWLLSYALSKNWNQHNYRLKHSKPAYAEAYSELSERNIRRFRSERNIVNVESSLLAKTLRKASLHEVRSLVRSASDIIMANYASKLDAMAFMYIMGKYKTLAKSKGATFSIVSVPSCQKDKSTGKVIIKGIESRLSKQAERLKIPVYDWVREVRSCRELQRLSGVDEGEANSLKHLSAEGYRVLAIKLRKWAEM